LAAVRHDRFNAASKTAALELLARLDDSQAVSPLVKLLPTMPQDVWPAAGQALHRLTGEDFGPHDGDGPVEVFTTIKRWRAWLKERGEP
jgi:hypothetical protein